MGASHDVSTGKFKNWQWLWQTQLGISVISIILSLMVLAVTALIYGSQPLAVLTALFQGALRGKQSIVSTLTETAPLILSGLAVLLPYRAGFFNIGGQGQLEIGAVAAVFVATTWHASSLVVMLVSLLVAMLVGVIGMVIPLLLKIKRGASEVTTTIMMNFASVNLVYALVTGVMKDKESFYGTTRAVPKAVQLPKIPEALGVHAGVWLAVVLALILFWFLQRSVFGMHLKAVGYNQKAAQAAGISVNKVLSVAVLLGAAMAGLAGGIEVLGVTERVAEGWSLPWGFTGISVAFLGGNALGVIPVSFLLAIMETGSRYMQAMTGVPSALIDLMKGIPVLVFICLKAAALLNAKRVVVRPRERSKDAGQEMFTAGGSK